MAYYRVLAVKDRLRDYRLFRANYGTVLQYHFLAQPTRKKQSGSLQRYSNLCQTLGYSSKRAIIGDAIILSQTLAANGDPPRTNTCSECTSSWKQPSQKEDYPLQEQGRLRAGYETCTELNEVLLYCLQQYKCYTINSGYPNVVAKESCAGHKDGAQKTEILSAESLAVKLLAP